MIKLEISTHSGIIDTVELEEYSADELNDKMNNNELHAILIGENIYNRFDLKNVRLLNEEG